MRALEGGARPCEVRLAQFLILTIRIEHNSYVIVYLWASARKRGEQRHCRAAIASAARPAVAAVGFSTDLFLRCDILSAVITFYVLGSSRESYGTTPHSVPNQYSILVCVNFITLVGVRLANSGRECNEFRNKNLVCVIFQLHLRRLSGWCLI